MRGPAEAVQGAEPGEDRVALVISVERADQVLPALASIAWGELWNWTHNTPGITTWLRINVGGAVVLEVPA